MLKTQGTYPLFLLTYWTLPVCWKCDKCAPHIDKSFSRHGQVESKHPEQGGTYSTRQASLNPFRLSRSNTDPQMSFQDGNYLIHSLHPRRLSLPNKDVRYAWYEWVLLLISSLWRSLLQYLTRTAQSSMPYLHGEPGAAHDGRQWIGCAHRDPVPWKDEPSRAWKRIFRRQTNYFMYEIALHYELSI